MHVTRAPQMIAAATAFLFFVVAANAPAAAAPAASRATLGETLFEITPKLLDVAKAQNARATVRGGAREPALRLESTGDGDRAELVLPVPQSASDLSSRASVRMSLHNAAKQPLTVRAAVENDDAKGLANACRGAAVLMPGETRELVVRLTRRPEDPGYERFKPFYMYSASILVRDNTIDPSRVARLVITIDSAARGQAIEVSGIRAAGEGAPAPVPFFPFVDAFGQYVHSDWPGKIYSDEDFAARRDEEAKERRDWPGPKDWNQYGGWAGGPTLKKTGFFYPKKHEGKWWLVDPEGRLFWSYGPTGVGFGGDVSPVTDRLNWFRDLPPRDDPTFGRFYKPGRNATYMYYQHREWLGFDVAAANLFRKYGKDYQAPVAELSHDRLRSWGFNTLANWSDDKVYALRRTPYTVAIHYGGQLIHYRMPDVYHPDWEKNVRARMEQERGKTAGDPWNLGYFVDNERWWGWRPRAAAIGEETLKNPPERHAKLKFVELLKKKYPKIDALNAAWKTSHASWDALLAHREAPDLKNPKVDADCGDFGMMFAERYFSACRDAVKRVAPNNLYLGPRFHGHVDPEVVGLAAKYCDVISYNIYDNPPDGRVNQYRRLDVPIMSTEWGIESDPQQTPFRGKEKPLTPAERAGVMARYAEHAIRHPSMVGAHFFQYRDQPISGRPDGEAVLRGFVNIADTPNFELIQANRRVAYEMYRTRAAAK
ncbi:MAG TPA: beta-galactosidase [Tepidisphaeraceae bacterium]|nr:beta-galactosidase [Tepidisphaeraceae bacterium]